MALNIYRIGLLFILIIYCVNLHSKSIINDGCFKKIKGNVITIDSDCSVNDLEISLYDSSKIVIARTKTDSLGQYIFQKQYSCAAYYVNISSDLTNCLLNISSNVEPIKFNIVNDNQPFQNVNIVFKRFIPTNSQWIILFIITLIFIVLSYFLKAFRLSKVGAIKNYNIGTFLRVPFHLNIYKYMLFLTMILVLVGFFICIYIYKSAYYSDIIGVSIAAPIFAYLLHILFIVEDERN